MNTQIAATKRPKLHWPKALLSSAKVEPRIKSGTSYSPTLSGIELRRIVAEMTG